MEPELVIRFASYLERILSPDQLRVRIYEVAGDPADDRVLRLTTKISRRPAYKMRRTAYHAYVNSRALVRRFFADRDSIEEIPDDLIGPYLAGRFDGDGNLGVTPRIAYTKQDEAETDARLLARAGIRHTSVLYYAKANEYCIYIHVTDFKRFKGIIKPYSWKVAHPVETEMASLAGKDPNL